MKTYSVTCMHLGEISTITVSAEAMEVDRGSLIFYDIKQDKVLAAFAPGAWQHCIEQEQQK